MHKRDDGTVLLSTLLVLSLMSAVALALLATVRTSVVRTGELAARSQADLYAQGARDFVQSQLNLVVGVEGAALNAQLTSGAPIVLPFDNGSITMAVSDGTHCFRLSALSNAAGLGSDTAQQRFDFLMQALGVDPNRAARIAAAAVDWVDRDSETRPGGAEDGTYLSRHDAHRTANVPMQSVTELRAINEMDEPLFRLLLPYLCLGTVGTQTQFNIDTATERHAPVLAAILGGGSQALQMAVDLIVERPPEGYGSEQALLPILVARNFDTAAVQLSDIVFAPTRVVAETIIRFGAVEQMQLLAYEGLDSRQPALSYRAWGWDEFPSVAWAQLQPVTDQGDAPQ
ncbi:MAG: type II secretion system minor pseudopilin GspK [Litorimonas sp.]